MILELKVKYNAILERQEAALKWFDSEDYRAKSRDQGPAFVSRAITRYRRLDEERIKILKDIEAAGGDVTGGDVAYGFHI